MIQPDLEAIALVARLALAAIFARAGIAKLRRPGLTQLAMEDFGLPGGYGAAMARGLPWLELAIAVALVPVALSRSAALVASVVLVAFTVGIAANLNRGRRPDCGCFGVAAPKPIGFRTVARNGLLLTLVAVVLVVPARSVEVVPGWIAALPRPDAGYLLLVLGSALAIWFYLRLRSSSDASRGRRLLGWAGSGANGSSRSAREGLPVGTDAPRFALENLAGGQVTLESLTAEGRPVILLFSDASCRTCERLGPLVGQWLRSHRERATLALITTGPARMHSRLIGEHGLPFVLLQEEREITRAYRVATLPAALLVDTDGRVASQTQLRAAGVAAILWVAAAFARRPDPGAPDASEGVPTSDAAMSTAGPTTTSTRKPWELE